MQRYSSGREPEADINVTECGGSIPPRSTKKNHEKRGQNNGLFFVVEKLAVLK